jgi:putative membrane protein
MAFPGTQGDIWDAQKHLLLAGTGAIIAMIIVFLVNLKVNPDTRLEVRASLRAPPGDHPLGESGLKQRLEADRR